MILISPFYTRSSYAKEAVDIFIEQTGYKVKYYGFYLRKYFMETKVYRYYLILPSGQKKLFLSCLLFFSTANRSLWNTFSAFYACMLLTMYLLSRYGQHGIPTIILTVSKHSIAIRKNLPAKSTQSSPY